LPAQCRRLLAAGESWSGRFSLHVTDAAQDDPLDLEIEIGDAEAFDDGAIVRAGFYGWFSQSDHLSMTRGKPLPSSDLREPPVVEVTRAPGLTVEGGHATVSGVVTDDRGLRHLMVFVGDDKVLYEGGGGPPRSDGAGPGSVLRSLPFTADVVLAPGANQVTVLATDADGYTAARSITTWSETSELAAK
jgi:hypothetical protein